MANTLKFKRGLLAGLPSAAVGEPLFTTDTFDLYIGTASGTQKYQKFIASGTTSQLLRGDGSLLTMPIVLTSPSNGQVLKYNGTNWVNDSDAGITGSGTTNYLPKFTGASTLGNSLVFDNGTSVGIGTITPLAASKLQVNGQFRQVYSKAFSSNPLDTDGYAGHIIVNSNNANGDMAGIGMYTNNSYTAAAGVFALQESISSASLVFYSGSNTATQRARITGGGNFIINNSSSDNGLRFQVTGDGYFSGAVGVGVSPSSWGGSLRGTIDLGSYGAVAASGTIGSALSWNAYHNGTSWIAKSTTSSYGVFVFDNSFRWLQASTGTAGSALTFTTAMTLNASGNLGIGTTPTERLEVSSSNVMVKLNAATNSFAQLGYYENGSLKWNAYNDYNTDNYVLGNASGAKLFLTQDGNLGLGVTPSAWASGTRAIDFGSGSALWNPGSTTNTYLTTNAYFDITDNRWEYKGTGGASNYHQFGNEHRWNIAASGTANAAITFTQAMTLDASGNLGVGITSPTQRLHVAGNSLIVGGSTWTTGVVATQFFGDIYGSIKYDYNTTNFTINSYGLFSIATNGTSPTTKFTVFANGNTAIGTTTDAGFKLDVNGTMRVSGASTFNGNLTVDTNTLFVDATNNRVGVGTLTPNNIIEAVGTTFVQIMSTNTATTGSNRGGGFRATGQTNGGTSFLGDLNAISNNANAPYNNVDGIYLMSRTSGFPLNLTVNNAGTELVALNISSTGAATFSSSVTATSFIPSSSTIPTNGIYLPSANTLGFATGTSARMWLTTSALGIGTASPQGLFEVSGAGVSYFTRGTKSILLNPNVVGADTNALIDVTSGMALAFGIGGTEGMRLTSTGLGIGMTPSYKLDVTGSARISDAIAIGTTPDTNLPFKILKNINSTVGIRFENTSTGASSFTGYQFGTDVSGGTAFTNFLYASSGVAETGVYKPNGTALINTGSGGLNFLAVSQPIRFFTSTGNGTLRAAITNDGDFTQYNGTNPSASTTDAFRMYSADITAGNAAPHFRTENGGIIKLYQQTTGVTSATYIGGAGTGLTDSDTFDGYTIAQIVKALRNAGLLA